MTRQGKKKLRKRPSPQVEIQPLPLGEEATPEAVKDWVVATYEHLTARAQAEMLGMNYGNLVALRGRLAKAKRIDFSKRAYQPRWSPEEVEAASEQYADGKTVRALARRGERTATAIALKLRRQHGSRRDLRDKARRVFTLRDVCRIFALDHRAIKQFWDRGWLTGKKASRPREPWVFRASDIEHLLGCRDSWIAWSPEQLTDGACKQRALLARHRAPGHWVKLADWCREHHYDVGTGNQWVAKRLLRTAKWQNHHFVWSTEIAQFIPPGQLPRRRKNAA
jgi:hypothetical protein